MIVQNLHTHTRYGDGVNCPEEMVLGAIRSGCTSLGFSEHSPLPRHLDPDGWSMAERDVDRYRAEVLALRSKYVGTLSLYLGLEQDMDSPAVEGPWDYRIGSVHSVWAEGRCLSVDNSAAALQAAISRHFGGDPLALAEAYYQRLSQVAAVTGCEIVGHFDLVTKFNEGGALFDESCPRYRDAALGALDTLSGRGLLFEINTGAMSRGYRTAPYPAPFLLRELCRRGEAICLTSDSHSAETVLHGFPQAAELARSCGFRESMVLTERGFLPQKLP